jgi:hypothetical protein
MIIEKRRFELVLLMWFSLVLLIVSFTFALEFRSSTITDFANGTYAQTVHNGSGIVLSGQNSTGNYTSQVFDSVSSVTQWHNMSVTFNTTQRVMLVLADAQSGVWHSNSSGVSWSQSISDYNGGDGNGAEDISTTANGTLVVLNDQDVWISTNFGVNWTKVNDDFNGVSIANSGLGLTLSSDDSIFIVDSGERVWFSANGGLNFTQVNASFNSGGQNAFSLRANSTDGLFIVDGKNDVWISIDFGASWTKVNDDFNGGGISANAFSMYNDAYNLLYVVDGLDNVYRSSDGGVTFSLLVSNINGGNGRINAFGGLHLQNMVSYQFRVCDLASCNDGLFRGNDGTGQTTYTTSFAPFNVTGRYFQYLLFFEHVRWESPMVFNMSIGYLQLNVAPVVNITFPLAGTYAGSVTSLNYTVSDANANLDSCWYSTTNGSINISIACGTNVTGLSVVEGAHTWQVGANDTFGATSSSTAMFIVDTTPPFVSFVRPTPTLSANRTVIFEINSSDADSVWFFNGSANQTYTGPTSTVLDDGSYTFYAYANDSAGNVNVTTVGVTLDGTAPTLVISSPADSSTIGNNVSVPFMFGAIDPHRDTCWYQLDAQSDIILVGCTNTTLNLSEGSHALYLYANDTLGNIAVEESLFTINVDAPSITLHSPLNQYLNYTTSIDLTYTPSDFDLDYCRLFGDFSGTYGFIDEDFNATSDVVNRFFVNVSDGVYHWAIQCTDDQNHTSITGNGTFTADTSRPLVSLTQPTGSHSSVSNIPLRFSYSDISPVYCTFNVTFAASGTIVIPTSILSPCDTPVSTTFTVDTPSSYILTLMITDYANNTNISRHAFTVGTTQNGGSGGSGGGGGGSISGRTVSVPPSATYGIALSPLEALIVSRGKSELVELPIRNSGNAFLNDCRFISRGSISEWFSSTSVYSLSPGQEETFVFSVRVPDSLDEQEYYSTIGITCKEHEQLETFAIRIDEGTFDFVILSSERAGTTLRTQYRLTNNGERRKDFSITYRLLDGEERTAHEGSTSIAVEPGATNAETLIFELPKNTIGNYALVFDVDDGFGTHTYSQPLLLRRPGGISGFAISEGNLKTISWFAIVAVLSAGIYAVTHLLRRELRSLRRPLDLDQRQFITIDLSN